MISLMGNMLLHKLLACIREACWFSIIANETRDMTSATLTAAIKDGLVCCILPLSNCQGQAYDGASNMMGHLRKVATTLQNEQLSAIQVHCLAHCLNLCLQDVARKCQPIRIALDVTMELSKLILYSPK